MPAAHHPRQHPLRAQLHNEIHARPPEAMALPLGISHVVMLVAAAIPVVALGVWWSLRRLHHRVFAARHG